MNTTHLQLIYRVNRVLGGCAECISVGSSAPFRREITSSIYHVVSGHGRSIIGDGEYEWDAGDILVFPRGTSTRALRTARQYTCTGWTIEPCSMPWDFHHSDEMDVEALVSG